MLTLNIEKRDKNISLDELRGGDKIPAVFYGNDVDSTPISLSYPDFKRVWKEAGSSSIISLKGIGEEKEVLIQDIDIDPVSDQVRHIDFYVVKRGQLMETEVPLEFVGESIAVKSLGGILVKALHQLKIEVLPKDLPKSIEVDISVLTELDSTISVMDLKLPEGVKTTEEPEETVAAISQAKEEVVDEEPIDIDDVEIEQKGKKEEDEGEESKEDKS